MSRLKEQYDSQIKAAMMKKFGYKNEMQIPKLVKIVVNMGVGDAKENHKIWNSILHMDIDVYMENIETGGTGYMAQFIYNGVCYYLSGAIEQNDFDEMLKKIHF